MDYQAKISGPLFDRIDLHMEVPAVSAADLTLPAPAEGAEGVAKRFAVARKIQKDRYAGSDPPMRTNAEADGALMGAMANPDADGRKLQAEAADRLKLSARGYHRVLRVARTLADIAAESDVRRLHVVEALSYRRVVPVR